MKEKSIKFYVPSKLFLLNYLLSKPNVCHFRFIQLRYEKAIKKQQSRTF